MRTIRAVDPNGNLVKVPLDKLKLGPIVHRNLSDDKLASIKQIHDTLKSVLPLGLEQFEVGFMRDDNVENEIKLWQEIAEAFIKASALFPPEAAKTVFEMIIALSTGSLTTEEMKREDIKVVMKTYYDVKTGK